MTTRAGSRVMDSAMRTMPFGRFRGIPLEEIPDPYVVWILMTVELREPLRSAIVAEAARRGLTPHAVPTAAPLRGIAEELIGAGLHVLARRHHPDVGGDLGTMQRVSAAASWLRGRLQELVG